MAYKKFQELAIYQAIEDLGEWLVPHVGRFPKWLRPTLGARMIDALLGLLKACTAAYAARGGRRHQLLSEASAELDCLRLLIKLSTSLRQTSLSQFSHATQLMADVGRQLGGWQAAVRKGEGGQ